MLGSLSKKSEAEDVCKQDEQTMYLLCRGNIYTTLCAETYGIAYLYPEKHTALQLMNKYSNCPMSPGKWHMCKRELQGTKQGKTDSLFGHMASTKTMHNSLAQNLFTVCCKCHMPQRCLKWGIQCKTEAG